MGDAMRLQEYQKDCRALATLVQQHTEIIPPNEYNIIVESLYDMIQHLETASHLLHDLPDQPPIITSTTEQSGRPGRPRIEIDPELLATAITLRGPTHLAAVFNCAPRTIRRRALEHQLVEPGPPVYIEYVQEDGSITRIYTSATKSTSLSNDELDTIVSYILDAFPSLGRRMIDGHLKHLGHKIPRARVRESYVRVCGSPVGAFGPYRIQRRVYKVAGPNSLWHHDGQHGLIRWKIVFHAFIDGFSRLVTGIRASNNNRANTVLDLFLGTTEVHGTPSRVRGDHGTENLLVAEYMETEFGIERGSYIWGQCVFPQVAASLSEGCNRSVHNVQIERLWRDLTSGFGSKWKAFFQDLEVHAGLIRDYDSHIWLLHHLFLPAINHDAIEWGNMWNSHSISIRNERQRSPKDMFFFGMIQNGTRGLDSVRTEDEVVDNIASSYGIDWDELEDDRIRTHHDTMNAEDGPGHSNPFVAYKPYPLHLSHVEVVEPVSPLLPAQLEYLQQVLEALPFFNSTTMSHRRQIWIEALHVCEYMMNTP